MGLYPDNFFSEQNDKKASENNTKTWLFDFEKGDFVTTPLGHNRFCDENDAIEMWSMHALSTKRFAYIAYPKTHGEEYDRLFIFNLPQAAIESEVRRMTVDALIGHEHIQSVDNFTFTKQADGLYFECTVTTDFGNFNINRIVEGV